MSIKVNTILANKPQNDCLAVVDGNHAIAFIAVRDLPQGTTGITIKDAFTSAQERLGTEATTGDLLAVVSRNLQVHLQ